MPIRKACADDLEAVTLLLDALGGYPHTESFLATKLPTILNTHEVNLFVYEYQETVIGLAAAQEIIELGLAKNSLLITYLVVSDQYRGMGIGRLLEQHCCELAISKGCGRIQLHCAAQRTRAHNFYQSLGYAESPRYFTKQLT